MEIFVPVLTLGVLGFLFGMVLAVASKRFAIKTDPRLEKIHGLLPGSNCGACGGAGCFGFAEKLLKGEIDISACRLSEKHTKEQIAEILGKKLENKVKLVATLHCYGGRKVKDRFLYEGIKDCVAANLVLGGQKECIYGCLGFGTCARICPFGAIKMPNEGLPVVDINKCKACNKCVLICPKKLFSLTPVTSEVNVACSSRDNAKDTKLVCPVGCIACRKCEQLCPVDAIHIVDNLAIIDYNKCTSCGECENVCPMKTIKTRISTD